jgi:cystathionine beta-synthase
MDYSENILGLIGHTPLLVRLNKLTKGIDALVLAKMESLSPRRIGQDRIGVSMIDAASAAAFGNREARSSKQPAATPASE